MVLNSRKGEVITVSLIAIAILSGIVGLWFGGTKYAKAVGLGSSGDGNKTKQVSKTVTESKPIIVKDQFGNPYILQATKTEISTLDTQEEPKMTFWQRILMLPKFILILSVLGVIFPGFGLWLIRLFIKLKSNFKQIVVGIEEARKELPPEAIAKLENSLSRKADNNTKELVKKIKVTL